MGSSRPRLPLATGNLPNISEAELAATASPARGKEMRQNLLAKLRPPTLVHNWDFWHDRQDRNKNHASSTTPASPPFDANTYADAAVAAASVPTPAATTAATTTQDEYESRLVKLHSISDVREFWEMFNNFDITSLPLRDTVHLFHRGIQPIWEDARNARGGSWTFRVPKDRALAFWKHIALMAIGEKLQQAVASKRITFLDDICGVSLSVRFNSDLVQIWNRDAKHEDGKRRILETVLTELPAELVPRDGSYYYKAHAEHAGFRAPADELASLITPTAT